MDVLAALLAEAVEGQWRQAAVERRLVTPAPIHIRWSLSDLAVTGSVTAAVGAPDIPPAFPPLPQQARITEADLHAGDGRAELHHVYAGLASGRVVVVGAPGAGKSGTAILLLLDALAHRDRLDDTERARVPVPVLLTAHGWDPTTRPVRDWLRDQLIATYPLFTHRGGRTEAAALVAARDKVALILDGLDELDAALRPAALQALSDAPFRVVVLTRSREMVQAASGTWLAGAVVVHLHGVTAPDVAGYLQQARTGPPPQGWTDLLTHLGEHPDGVLARGLSTPLTLTLLRDTYQASDDVRELLDPTRYRTTDAIEQHLIARVLPAAYTPRPGRPPPRYTEQQARQTLSFIARKMGKDRDLAWWDIPRWALATPGSPSFGFVSWLVSLPTSGLVFGLAIWLGPVSELVPGPEVPLVVALVVALVALLGSQVGLAAALRGGQAGRFRRIVTWRGTISRHALKQGIFFRLIGGLTFGFVFGYMFRTVLGPVVEFVFGFVYGFVFEFTESDTGALAMGPRQAWRNNRLSWFMFGFVYGPVFWLVLGPAFWVAFTLTSGLMGSETWSTTVIWFQLQLARHVPAVSLMPFLEDARERDILRTVGAVYQFRHATLQDQLAAVPVPVVDCG